MQTRRTVIIPCKNERTNIRACIESVRGLADEILVADSGSTDGTLEIVRGIGGCRIIQREYVHPGDFKNWAIPQTHGQPLHGPTRAAQRLDKFQRYTRWQAEVCHQQGRRPSAARTPPRRGAHPFAG